MKAKAIGDSLKMNRKRNPTHDEVVQIWEEKNSKGLGSQELARLFSAAIRRIEQRSLVTLSSITIRVVVDRALHESREKFPILSVVTVDPSGLNCSELISQSQPYTPEQIGEALRYLLIELLNVIGSITADVLTAPLHKELMEVTYEHAPESPEIRKLNRGKS